MSDTTQDHAAAIRRDADMSHDRSAIKHRCDLLSRSTDAVSGVPVATVAREIDVLIGNIAAKHDDLARQLAEARKDADYAHAWGTSWYEDYREEHAKRVETEAENARLRVAYLAAEARIVAAAEERTVGSLASRVAGLLAQHDCRRPLHPGDLRDAGEGGR
jgi:hypothetical protein